MKALITGITGFLGSHLAEHLLSQGVEVEGITRYPRKMVIPCNLQGIRDKITMHEEVYISSSDRTQLFLQEHSDYDYIFHLESVRFLSPAWIHNTNVIGTANLLEAVHNMERKSGQHPVIVIPGCGEMYGIPPLVYERYDGPFGFMGQVYPELQLGVNPSPRRNRKPNKILKLPITEDFPLNPVSSYAVSKAAQDMLGFQYHKEYGMKIVRARLFDIAGPRCHQSLLPSGIAKQMTELEKGRNEPEIKVASPEYARDYTDVRDAARALWLAATKCKYGEAYNICSGRGRTVQQVIDILRMQSTAQFEIVQDRTMMHPNDIIALVGDCTKFYKRTGWKPEIGFAQSMGDMLEWWRGKI
uniref:Putative GDP-mannose 4,6-dehydratase n=1 Tax=viral metagenome TaxID=1070528 RepID=A0A6M3M0M5_9ZZZZ